MKSKKQAAQERLIRTSNAWSEHLKNHGDKNWHNGQAELNMAKTRQALFDLRFGNLSMAQLEAIQRLINTSSGSAFSAGVISGKAMERDNQKLNGKAA